VTLFPDGDAPVNPQEGFIFVSLSDDEYFDGGDRNFVSGVAGQKKHPSVRVSEELSEIV
jgi:hypothetical protein